MPKGNFFNSTMIVGRLLEEANAVAKWWLLAYFIRIKNKIQNYAKQKTFLSLRFPLKFF